MPDDLGRRILKQLTQKKLKRTLAFVKAYCRWTVKLRRRRGLKKWFKAAGVVIVIRRTFFRSLAKCRYRIAAITVQAGLVGVNSQRVPHPDFRHSYITCQ